MEINKFGMDQPITPKKCVAMVELAVAVKAGKDVQIATKKPQQYIDRFRHYVGLEIELVKVIDDLFDVKLK